MQLFPPGLRYSIVQTQITDTNDLLALVHIEDQFKLFLIDLDAYDLINIEELQANPQSLFYSGKRTPIFEYSEKDVDFKNFV